MHSFRNGTFMHNASRIGNLTWQSGAMKNLIVWNLDIYKGSAIIFCLKEKGDFLTLGRVRQADLPYFSSLFNIFIEKRKKARAFH